MNVEEQVVVGGRGREEREGKRRGRAGGERREREKMEREREMMGERQMNICKIQLPWTLGEETDRQT